MVLSDFQYVRTIGCANHKHCNLDMFLLIESFRLSNARKYTKVRIRRELVQLKIEHKELSLYSDRLELHLRDLVSLIQKALMREQRLEYPSRMLRARQVFWQLQMHKRCISN